MNFAKTFFQTYSCNLKNRALPLNAVGSESMARYKKNKLKNPRFFTVGSWKHIIRHILCTPLYNSTNFFFQNVVLVEFYSEIANSILNSKRSSNCGGLKFVNDGFLRFCSFWHQNSRNLPIFEPFSVNFFF